MRAGERLLDWLDARTGLRALVRHTLDEPVPGGARLRYVFGSVLTYLFVQQVAVGVLLAVYYSPSATDAWASVAYIQDRVSAGWFLRGLHHHGSSAMVVVLVLHLSQVVLAGAYRPPRELNWWTGLSMGLLVLAFCLTGYLLPWDQKGYWATKVATGIVGSVPLVGRGLQDLLQGGSEYGNLTLTRFYALHVFVLPALVGTLVVAHIALFRRHGVTTPAALDPAELARRRATFWPDQMALDGSAMALTGAVLVALTFRTHGAELLAPADPSSSFVARPEWYFLFLFQLLKYFEGPLQIVATVILPGAATLLLFALPWLDRAGDRRLRGRVPVLVGVGTGLGSVAALTGLAVLEDRRDERLLHGLDAAREQAVRARDLAVAGVLPEGGPAVWRNDPRFGALELFREHCSPCHGIDALVDGGEEAPDLSEFSSRAWLRGAIREPRSVRYFGGTKQHKDMEAYPVEKLSDDQLAAVVEYLLSLRADPEQPFAAELAARGRSLWDGELECNGCHEVEPGVAGGAPNFAGRGTAAWVARVIVDSGAPDLYGDVAEMPKFAGKLAPPEIEQLAALVHSLGLGAGADATASSAPDE